MDFNQFINSGSDKPRKAFPSRDSILLTSRVRLARNLIDHPFPGWTRNEDRRIILDKISSALKQLPALKNGLFAEMNELTTLQKLVLIEKHLISRELATRNEGCAVAISRNQTISIMLNEEDHLRFQIILPGLSVKKAWSLADALDSSLEDHLDYAYSKYLGYLTACPSNIGTGLRVSAQFHLPGIVLGNHVFRMIESASSMGLTVRGLYGEGSCSFSNIFQISNQTTLGEKESDLVDKLDRVSRAIVQHEINARFKLLESEESRNELTDKIERSLGILAYSSTIGAKEALSHLSLLRMGCDMRLLDCKPPLFFSELLVKLQPGIMQMEHSPGSPLAQEERDKTRAKILKQAIKKMNIKLFA